MNEQISPTDLAARFHETRPHLRTVAYRMLGSAEDADDAVQETWLRALRTKADAGSITNVTGWLTTVVGRVCLDMLRARVSRREELTDTALLEPISVDRPARPDEEAELADSVGLAMLVVLDRLSPAERVAFVLHDLFAVPFDTIAQIVDRSPVAAKKLASRARQRMQGATAVPATDLRRQRQVVEAFLAASRAGNLNGLLAVLAPDVARRADAVALRPGAALEARGARQVAGETLTNSGRAQFARPLLVDGRLGVAVAPLGRLELILEFDIRGDHITAINVVGDRAELQKRRLSLLGDSR